MWIVKKAMQAILDVEEGWALDIIVEKVAAKGRKWNS
jgi:hypothetical protein